MHEGAVCTEIIDIVTEAAKRNMLKRVDEIIITVGAYSCLYLDQLNFYFKFARVGTCMENAFITMEKDESIQGTRQMYVKSIVGE